MLDIFFQRLRQKKRTLAYPDALPQLPGRFRGRPFIDIAACRNDGTCDACRQVCPVGAITVSEGGPRLDTGVCVFCGACATACPSGALVFTTDWRLASTDREALVVEPSAYTPGASDVVTQSLPYLPDRTFSLPELPLAPTQEAGGTFRRSFRLRQVTAAGCGACEADLNVLATIVFDIGRFGMDFVASPRHADGLVLTGPVPRNMAEALGKCHAAMPSPKPLLAVGTCAISGGLFRSNGGYRSGQDAEGVLPHRQPDVYIPGCPPHPYTSLDGLLRFIGIPVPVP